MGTRNTLFGEEIKDLIISFGKPYKPVSQDRFEGELRVNLQTHELTHLFSKLINVAQHPLVKRGRLVFH